MTRSKWVKRFSTMLISAAAGTMLFGTSCSVEVRDSLIGAGADFAGDSLGTILQAIFPVEDWVGADDAG